jgi:hypothetical protein
MITNKYLKTGALASAMLIGASAFASNAPVVVTPGDGCNSATTLTNAYFGQVGHETFTSYKSENTSVDGSESIQPSCWQTAADNSSWFTFQVPKTGFYTITANTGKNALDEDTQIALWDGCGGDLLACSEDADDDCDGDNFAAAVGFEAEVGEDYLLQIDIFGTTTGNFTFNILESGSATAPKNDNVIAAIGIGTEVSALSSNKTASAGWFMYGSPMFADSTGDLDTTFGPTYQGPPAACTNPALTSGEVHDVWFKFTADGTEDFLLSAFNKRGEVFFGLEVFLGNPLTVGASLGCSVGDGFGVTSGADEACGNFFDHPRVRVNPTSAGVVYIRVYQFPRVAVGATNTLADACYGFFKLAFEQPANCGPMSAVYGGYDDSDCKGALTLTPSGVEGKDTILCFELSNAGMQGGLSVVQGSTCNTGGRVGEPGEFIVPGGSTIEYGDCDEDNGSIFADPQEYYNNNSVFYNFNVIEDVRVITLEDTLFSVTLFDSIVVIPDPAGGDDIAIPDQELVATISLCQEVLRTNLDGIETGPLPPPLDQLCRVKASCGADVKFTFSNMNYSGVNGNTFEAFVVPVLPNGDFGAPVTSYFGGSPDDACDDCWSMRSANFYLPEGDYCLVVDGEDGNIVEMDMCMDIQYLVPGTSISCAGAASTTLPRRAVSMFEFGLKPTSIAPNPATNFTNVNFTVPAEGTVVYQMLDLNGRVVQEGSFVANEGNNVRNFNMEGQEAGLYMLNLTYDNYTTSIKLMKQ